MVHCGGLGVDQSLCSLHSVWGGKLFLSLKLILIHSFSHYIYFVICLCGAASQHHNHCIKSQGSGNIFPLFDFKPVIIRIM